jgi:hypothetical protein
MVSQTLASAILNQKGPDLVGSFREGQEFAKGQQVEKLTGQALQAGGGQKLQELIGLDPEVGYSLGEAIGARSAKELNNFIRDASITENFFKQGNFDQGRQFIQQSRDTAAMSGMSTKIHDNLLNIYDNEGVSAAFNQVQAVTSSLAKSKEKPTTLSAGSIAIDAKGNVLASNVVEPTQNELDKEALGLAELKLTVQQKLQDLNKVDKPDVGEVRSIQGDVTKLIQKSVDIRGAAANLGKLSKTKSATDQLAAVFSFMKALDPSSVVREGEQQQAANAGGVADAFRGYISNLKGTGSLPPDVFNKMVRTAERLANQEIESANTSLNSYIVPYGDLLQPNFIRDLKGRAPLPFNVKEEPVLSNTPNSAVLSRTIVD